MFQRLINLIKAKFNAILRRAEARNPREMLNLAKENLRESLRRYNEGLARHAGMCESLISQIRTQTNELRTLEGRIMAQQQAGNNEIAAELALNYEKTANDLETNKQELAQAEETYKELLRARQQAEETAKREIERLSKEITETEMKQAQAEMLEMASASMGQINSQDGLSRIAEMVKENRELASGRARVAKDSMQGTFAEAKMKEAEHKAMASSALARFNATKGVTAAAPVAPAATPTAPAAEPVRREMAPASKT